jgi:hypothetical protein
MYPIKNKMKREYDMYGEVDELDRLQLNYYTEEYQGLYNKLLNSSGVLLK